MKGLMRYLSPFAPDQSGASAVLFELGGMIIICDAGGCAGNVCGFDEPRWFTKKSAIYSAGLRDMDAILGRDDRLIGKIEKAILTTDAEFIALIGTPVPAVIGTDLRGLAKIIERKFEIPSISMETKGMVTYEEGEEKAYEALLELSKNPLFIERMKKRGKNLDARHYDVGIFGATPLELPAPDSAKKLRERIYEKYGLTSVTYGMDSDIYDILTMGKTDINLAVSPAGLAMARKLCNESGARLKTGFVYGEDLLHCFQNDAMRQGLKSGSENLREKVINEVIGSKDVTGSKNAVPGTRALILHQQFFANEIRNMLRNSMTVEKPETLKEVKKTKDNRDVQEYGAGCCRTHAHDDICQYINVASFFKMVPEYMEEGDIYLKGEKEFCNLVEKGGYDVILGDPLFKRALPRFRGQFLALPHYAVSGGIYARDSEEEYLSALGEVCP